MSFNLPGGMNKRTPPKALDSRICDFSRGGLNARLCARIQTLLRGHRFYYPELWAADFFNIQYRQINCDDLGKQAEDFSPSFSHIYFCTFSIKNTDLADWIRLKLKTKQNSGREINPICGLGAT